jgi:altronate hydrolase
MSIEKAKVPLASYSTAKSRVLQLDPRDNVLVALTDLGKGERIRFLERDYVLSADVPAKHKFVTEQVAAGGEIIMYGVLVGKATEALRPGDLLATRNLRHAAREFHETEEVGRAWTPPDVSAWRKKTFAGYHRADGQVGSRNYWIVVPLVFCENRNLAVLKQAFEEELGFAAPQVYRRQVRELVRLYREG